MEERHRLGTAIVYFLHVHKGGGSTLCSSAIANNERTTKQYENTDSGNPLDVHGVDHNCNVFWRVDGVPEKLGGRKADSRLRGSALEQMEAADDLGRVCRRGAHLPPPKCGISFVANELELPPFGEFLVHVDRPWVYVAVVRDPLDLVLSDWMMQHNGAIPGPEAMLEALESGCGHLVWLFCGVRYRRSGAESEERSETGKARLAQAVSRLKHFSAVIDTSRAFDNGYSVLAHRLGWTREVNRAGTHNFACASQLPAFLEHSHVRAKALAKYHHDIRFYHIASAFAAHQFRELAEK